jgi:hypothetical protein
MNFPCMDIINLSISSQLPILENNITQLQEIYSKEKKQGKWAFHENQYKNSA